MDYVEVPLQYQKTVFSAYVRPQLQGDSEDAKRTLFATNLPLDITIDNVRDMCTALGGVVLDNFERLGARHGLITLADEKAAERFLRRAKKLGSRAVLWTQYGGAGAEAYIARHLATFPSESELMQAANEHLELFGQQEEAEEEERQRLAEQVDEEGFRLVVKKRPAGVDFSEPVQPKKKKKVMEKTDFYRFQLRERRKQEATDLLKRYEEDKKRVEELKQRRAFAPF